jgi:hypothetical protein
MENKQNSNKGITPQLPPTSVLLARWSVYLGGLGLIGGFVCLPLFFIWELPSSLFLGLLGIACAVMSKKGKPFTKQAQLGLILSILSLVSGLVITFSIIFVYDLMDSDTILGEQIRNTLQSYLDSIKAAAPVGE